MWDFAGTTDRVMQLRRIVRRETVRLVVLTGVATAVFLATRLLAERAEHLEVEDASAWHERGQQHLAAGDLDRAAVAFRRAVMKHRGEERYVLALADALSRAGHYDPAVRALQGLRELSPEDLDVNLALARLNRAHGRPADAVRYYHHAMYAPNSTPDDARTIRLELVRMLLDADETTRAQSELIAATVDLPDSRDLRLEIARLFERADNDGRAAEQYRRVLENAPDDLTALEGAVRTTFELGNFREVLTYRLPESAAADVREMRTVAREVVSRDPLATRLSAAERRRRLFQNITYMEQRWIACGEEPRPNQPTYPEALVALRKSARPAAIGRDSEALESGLATLDALRKTLEQRCGERTPIDRALEIIARLHGVAEA